MDGTNGETMPALADDNGARYVGRVSLDDVAGAQYSNLIIPTIGIRKFQLAFENGNTASLITVVRLSKSKAVPRGRIVGKLVYMPEQIQEPNLLVPMQSLSALFSWQITS